MNRIVVTINGGLVESVMSKEPCELLIIDKDTDGATEEDGVDLVHDAFISVGETEVDAAEVDRLYADMKGA